MMKPILNINGTSPDELIRVRLEARKAILTAIRALGDIAPNGRDYIGNPEAMKRDQAIHAERVRFLDRIYNELEEEAEAIMEAVH